MACPNVPIRHLQCVNDSRVIPIMSTQTQYRMFKHFLSWTKAHLHMLLSRNESHHFFHSNHQLTDNKNEEHAGIVDQWPWVRGSSVCVCACVNLTLAPQADWLLIPWCVFGLCSHSYCIYGCVSAHFTNHTHSHSLQLCLPLPHYHLTYKTQPCNSFTVILYYRY